LSAIKKIVTAISPMVLTGRTNAKDLQEQNTRLSGLHSADWQRQKEIKKPDDTAGSDNEVAAV